jgi:hypothetical protein
VALPELAATNGERARAEFEKLRRGLDGALLLPLDQQALVGGAAGIGAVLAEVVVAAVDRDDRLAVGLWSR